jgi:alkanesulfonate monooxygenase SsuD/methylene tetrahydromethanopterin reductase-like flavin-dependent oxidoreductase (luciferase family)
LFLRHHFEVAAPRWATTAPGLGDAYLRDQNGDIDKELVMRSCLVGSPDDHVKRIDELRALGVENVNLYLVDSGQSQTIRAYAQTVLPQLPGIAASASR